MTIRVEFGDSRGHDFRGSVRGYLNDDLYLRYKTTWFIRTVSAKLVTMNIETCSGTTLRSIYVATLGNLHGEWATRKKKVNRGVCSRPQNINYSKRVPTCPFHARRVFCSIDRWGPRKSYEIGKNLWGYLVIQPIYQMSIIQRTLPTSIILGSYIIFFKNPNG